MVATKGIASIREAFAHDLNANWRSKEELEAKLKWVLDRADKYATLCGVSRDEVLAAWESRREYWWLNYYQECNQPDPDRLTGYPVMLHKDWAAMGAKLYGPDMLDWRFRCPACDHVQTLREFKNAGIDPDYGTVNCASRFRLGGKMDCNWSTGGLFRIGGRYVINRNFVPVLVFDFADSETSGRKALTPGDIVRIWGVQSPLNGKTGEVVELLPDGNVDVRVAEIRIDGSRPGYPQVGTYQVPSENLVFDKRLTERFRGGNAGFAIV